MEGVNHLALAAHVLARLRSAYQALGFAVTPRSQSSTAIILRVVNAFRSLIRTRRINNGDLKRAIALEGRLIISFPNSLSAWRLE
jgi:hypothetical protein